MKTLARQIKTKFAGFTLNDLYLGVFLLPLIFNPLALSYYEPPKILFLVNFTSFAAILAALKISQRKLTFVYNRWVYLLLGLWLLSLSLSTATSIAPQLSFFGSYDRLQGMFVQMNYLFHFLLIFHIAQSPEFPRKILKMFYFTGLVLAVLGLVQKFGISLVPTGLEKDFVGRVYATLGHPNFLGQFLLFPVFIVIHYLISDKKFRWFHLLALLLMLAVLYFTGNRASLLGFLVALPVFLSPFLARHKQVKFLVIPLIIALGGVLVYMAASNFRSMESRLLLWQTAPTLIQQKPLLGSGPETLPYIFPQYYNPQFTYFETANSIPDRLHNETLDTLVSQGIFGGLIYLLAFFLAFYLSFKNHAKPYSVLYGSALLAIFVSNQFGFSMSSNHLEIFTILALIAAEYYQVKTIKTATWNPLLRSALSALLILLSIWNFIYPIELVWADQLFGQALDQMVSNQQVDAAKTMITADRINPHQGYLFQLSASQMMSLANQASSQKTFYLDTANFLLDQGQSFLVEDYQYYLLKAKIAVLSNDSRAAGQLYAKAASLAPQISEVYLEWAKSCGQLKDYECFAEQLEKYLQLIPDYWKKGRNLSLQTPENAEKFRIFLKQNPEFWDLLDILATYYTINGQPSQAAYYQKLLK